MDFPDEKVPAPIRDFAQRDQKVGAMHYLCEKISDINEVTDKMRAMLDEVSKLLFLWVDFNCYLFYMCQLGAGLGQKPQVILDHSVTYAPIPPHTLPHFISSWRLNDVMVISYV